MRTLDGTYERSDKMVEVIRFDDGGVPVSGHLRTPFNQNLRESIVWEQLTTDPSTWPPS